MVWLARLSLANRAIVGLVTALLVVFGVFSTTSLRQELLPSLDVPVATVVTAYPGASPEVVEQQVTEPIEAAVGGITGVTGTHSTTTGGSSVIVVNLEYGTNLDELTSQLQRAAQGASLPSGITPKVVTGSTNSLPVAQLAVSSNLDADRVAAVLRDQVSPLLTGLDGVADVTLSGIQGQQITIDVDTAAAAKRGVSLNSVLTLLQANGVRVPAGQLSPDTNPLTVEVGSPITSVDALKDLYLASSPSASSSTRGTTGGAAGPPTGRVQPSVMLHPDEPRRAVITLVPAVMSVPPPPTPPPRPTSPSKPKPTSSPTPQPTPTPTPTTSPEPQPTPTPAPDSPTPRPSATPPGEAQPPQKPPLSGGAKPPAGPQPGATGKSHDGASPPAGAPTGPPVRLGDIATITAAPAPATGYTRTNGVPSIGIGITKKVNANTVAVSDEIHDALPRVTDMLGGAAQNAKVTVVSDQAPSIRASINDLATEGLLGLAFAVLVILAFLLSTRATLVTATSIPLSVIIAMIVLYLGGYTLNLLTLAALTVAVGRVVDDSIVVIENIKRHIGYGGPKRAAIMTAVGEVAGAITASTATTVAVFAPIGLVGGQIGALFRPFAVTVVAALLASLLVSLTVVPVLSSMVLRGGTEQHDREPQRSWLQRGYLPLLRSAVHRPVVSLLIAVGILAGTLALVPQLSTNFLGSSLGDTLSISQELAPGAALPAADAAAKRVENVLGATPGVASYQVNVGSTDGGSSATGRPGQNAGGQAGVTKYSVTLDKSADPEAVQNDLRARLAALGPPDQLGRLTVQGGGSGVGSDQLLVTVRAKDPAVLSESAGAVQKALESIPGATDVRNNLAAASAGVSVAVDRQKAAQEGLTEAQIGQSVATALRGSTAGRLTIGGLEQTVIVRTGTAPGDLDALRALPLTGIHGTIALSDVATVTQTSTAPSISHTDGSRSAEVTAVPTADDLGAVSTALADKLDALALPPGASAEIGGVSTQQNDAFSQLGLALLAAIAVVYLVMVLTFRSLLQPLLLLVAIPFAATGALGLLLLTGTPLGVPSLIGMLMLVGIVVTNAIVLIDLINQFRRGGRELFEAVIEGAAQRLRPILMTAVATVFALLPMGLGITGGGLFISQPLAIVVIGGLISSTLLTLVLVPVLYVLAARFQRGSAAVSTGDDQPLEPPVMTAATITLPAIETAAGHEDNTGRELADGSAGPAEPADRHPASLSGEIRSAAGAGVAALVALLNPHGQVIAGTRADARGSYRFAQVPAGEHVLLVSPPSGDSAVQPVALPVTGTVRHDVTLPGLDNADADLGMGERAR